MARDTLEDLLENLLVCTVGHGGKRDDCHLHHVCICGQSEDRGQREGGRFPWGVDWAGGGASV